MAADPDINDTCNKVLVVFARGSGQNSDKDSQGRSVYDTSDTGLKDLYREAGVKGVEKQTAKFFEEIHKQIPSGVEYLSLHNQASTSGQQYNKYGYAAVSAFDAIDLPFNAYNKPAQHRKDVANRYYESVKDGAEELTWYLEDQMTSCPLRQVVLGGYSQGAEVVGDALNMIQPVFRQRIAYTGLFGDPKFNAISLSSDNAIGHWYRGNASFVTHGILDARRPYLPQDISQMGSWCASGDAICDAGALDRKAAASYIRTKFIDHYNTHSDIYQEKWIAPAVKEAVGSLKSRLASLTTNTSVYVNKNDKLWNLDLAVVIDRTSSMQSAIGQIKGNATGLTTGLLGSYWNSRVSVVTYGGLPSGYDDTGYEYSKVVTPFTNNEDNVREGIKSITAQQTSYGTLPDGTPYQLRDQAAQYDGIMTAIQKLHWENGAQKKIIVITNNKTQTPDPSPNHWTTDQVRKAAFDLDPAGLNLANVSCDETWNCDYSIDEAFQQLANDSGGQVGDVNLSFGTIDDLSALLESMHTQPVPKLSGDQNGYAGVPVFLNGSESYDPNSAITGYAWDCTSDGTWDSYVSWPAGSCTYSQPGDYLVTLSTGASDDQQNSLAVWPVHISAGPAPSIATAPDTPHAKLDYRTDGQLLSWNKGYDLSIYIKVSDAEDNLMGYAPADTPGILLQLGSEMGELHVRAGNGNAWSEPAVVTIDPSQIPASVELNEEDSTDTFTILGTSVSAENPKPETPTPASEVISSAPVSKNPTLTPSVTELIHHTNSLQLTGNTIPELFSGSGYATGVAQDAQHVLGSITQQNKSTGSVVKQPGFARVYGVLLLFFAALAVGWGVWRYTGRSKE